MNQNEMDKRIESALDSLEHVTRVGPGPFFYTRLQARLNRGSRTVWEKLSGFIAQPAIAFSVICLVVSLNTLVIFKTKSGPSFSEQSSSMLSEDVDADVFAFYDEDSNPTAIR